MHIRDRHGNYMKTGGGRLIISQNGRSTSLKALTLPQYNLALPSQAKSKSSMETECSDSEEQSLRATEPSETKVSEESNSDHSYCPEVA